MLPKDHGYQIITLGFQITNSEHGIIYYNKILQKCRCKVGCTWTETRDGRKLGILAKSGRKLEYHIISIAYCDSVSMQGI